VNRKLFEVEDAFRNHEIFIKIKLYNKLKSQKEEVIIQILISFRFHLDVIVMEFVQFLNAT